MRLEHASSEPSLRAGLHEPQSFDDGEEKQPVFPSALYFQVHFEYIEKLLGETRLCLEALKKQVAESGIDTPVGSVDKIEHRFFERPVALPKLALQCKSKPRKSPRKTAPNETHIQDAQLKR